MEVILQFMLMGHKWWADPWKIYLQPIILL